MKNYFSDFNHIFFAIFDHIRTLYFSTIHAYGSFNKFRMVFINFSLTTIKFSNTRSACSRHIRLICSVLTFDPNFFVVSALIISKHYISQWYMPMDLLTSLGLFVSTFHWLSSIFQTPDVYLKNTQGEGLTLTFLLLLFWPYPNLY